MARPHLRYLYRYQILKRTFDFFVSIIALIFLTPIMLFALFAVIVESPGCPIYMQERLGLNGKKFIIYKIRSMYIDAEKNGPQWAAVNDLRITRVGKILRYTHLDELPQLINILKGDMSIVGPRPEREVFIKEFEKNIPRFRERLSVQPGLTGYAQINGGYDNTPGKKLEYDLYYIKNRSFTLDLKIILRTVTIIITGKGVR